MRELRRRFYGMSREDLARHQRSAFSELWSYVRENSPYYRRRYPEADSLEEISPCSRGEFSENFNDINTAGLDGAELAEFRIREERKGRTGYFRGRFSVGLSSGTTGSRLLTVLSKDERDLYSCLLWARNGLPPGIRTPRVLFALRTHNPTFTEIGVFGVRMVYVDYTHPPEELAALINRKRLNILAGPPSLLLMIARHQDKIGCSIDALVSYAEVLDDAAKARLERAFGAPVVQIYQGAEGFLGSTCKCGNLHLNEDVILVEPLGDPAAGPVQVLVTDLYRRTQPMIRYRMDDFLELADEPCPCGSAFRRIRRIHGRADDVFVLLDDKGRPRYLFPDYVRRSINQASEEILEYQAIQHSTDLIEIRLSLGEGADRSRIESAILENLIWRAGQIGANLGTVRFNGDAPERNPSSLKWVRVNRRFPWNF